MNINFLKRKVLVISFQQKAKREMRGDHSYFGFFWAIQVDWVTSLILAIETIEKCTFEKEQVKKSKSEDVILLLNEKGYNLQKTSSRYYKTS